MHFTEEQRDQYSRYIHHHCNAIVVTRDSLATELAIASGKKLTNGGGRGYVHLAQQMSPEDSGIATHARATPRNH
ncbi:hypothetical protein [Rosistilla carotiformis]|uniref:hypothetical protein n=1 Tax=Rosistilla carotiformis TaxID=2528017 RepID=UPI001E4F1131|nr:hypothetical protein [Rosistilla carotiformis]